VTDLIADKGHLRRVRKLIRLMRVPLYRRGLRSGVGAAIEHADVPLRSSFRTVIDVGAHHGQFALFAAHAFPEAPIYCVEPYPPSRAKLARFADLLPQMTVFPFAASDVSGEAPLFISRKTDSSSLLSIMNSYTTAFPGTAEVGAETIETRPLDSILAHTEVLRPSLLKIDVQGSELSVLRGAVQTLERIDAVLVECSFLEFYRGQSLIGDVVSYLNGAFVLEGVFGVVRDGHGRCLQADLLFRRNESEE
jgi:FkbM family methyltransferase